MAHTLATALQQTNRIRQRCAMEEPNVDVSFEGIDVTEWRVAHARNRTSVMHKLPDIGSTLSHDFKPLPRDGSQFTFLLFDPRVYRWISLDGTGKPQDSIHSNVAGQRFTVASGNGMVLSSVSTLEPSRIDATCFSIVASTARNRGSRRKDSKIGWRASVE